MSVVLFDVQVGPVEQVTRRREAELLQDLPYLDSDGAVTGLTRLPTGEANLSNDAIDVGDDFLDDDRHIVRLELIQNLREGTDVRVREQAEDSFFLCMLSSDDLSREVEEFAEELDGRL